MMKLVEAAIMVRRLDTDSRQRIQYGGLHSFPFWSDMHSYVLSTSMTAYTRKVKGTLFHVGRYLGAMMQPRYNDAAYTMMHNDAAYTMMQPIQ